MQAAPVARPAEPGTITVELRTLSTRFDQLRRFAEIKRQMRELRVEYGRLEEELFGAAAEDAS